ncbi:MAG: DUF1836 domain-containing protein [Oscillospiraceae bacterium]|nr:DUF1836 domain-containing protein [Oscillospiraceae bacterium]
MQYDKDAFSEDYRRASDTLRCFVLPSWEELPDLELYMDQMIVLINRYLSPVGGTGKEVTASMINNYVKMRMMPPPVRKKYGRAHLAYLIVICLLKEALSMSVIGQMFPPGMEGALLQERYNAFVANQVKAYHFVADNIDSVAIPLLQESEHISERIHDLVMQVGVSASITKNLAERFAAQSDDTKKA